MSKQSIDLLENDPRITCIDLPFKKIISGISEAFGKLSNEKGRRATHSYGTTAVGIIEILDNKLVPEHDVFRAKKRYPVLLRHANIKGFYDDAILDGRGATIRILEGDPDGDITSFKLNNPIVDILLSTGRSFIFSEAKSFALWVASDMKKRNEILQDFPDIAPIFSEIIRDPETYTKLHYYSETTYKFVALDGKEFFLRYRLVNKDDVMADTGWIEPSKVRLPLDFLPRAEGDKRTKTYLQDDFSYRVKKGGVNYLLQLQLQPITKDKKKNEAAKNCTIPWDEKSYPFLDIANLSINKILPIIKAEPLEYNPYHAPASLALILAKKSSETASINHLRSVVYQVSANMRKYQLPDLNLEDGSIPESPSIKEQFVYGGTAGIDLPSFDSTKKLPIQVLPKLRYAAHFGLNLLLSSEKVKKGDQLGIIGVPEIVEKFGITYMPSNLTRMHPDKFSDDFFVERRLNGFNPGKMNPVCGKEWQYSIHYDCSKYKVEASGILPKVIEARFIYGGQHLHVHSIEYKLDGKVINSQPGNNNWEWAKRLFRCVEFIFQETQSHLARTHMNLDQYAMAFYRNIDNNPIKTLLEPHLEGLLNINKKGASLIKGKEGFIPQASSLDTDEIDDLILSGVSELNYHNWSPKIQALPDFIYNNYFDRAAIAMWKVLEEYVDLFFNKHEKEIKKNWVEIDEMSNDLITHSILKKELGTLKICGMDDLRQLCIYIIYMSTFFHSWVNNKQYEDGGDIEYASIGLWDNNHSAYNPLTVLARQASQVTLLWTLSSVRYNPIMEFGSIELKNLLWRNRNEIEQGLSLNDIMMSINI